MSGLVASGLTEFLRSAVEPQVQVDAIGQGAIFALMAVGIGLVFGVLRLVNFAYGQLIMAGAFALAFASEQDWPVWAGIALCVVVVLALTFAMDVAVFRPLRTQSPATMLIATFAVAFLLQSVALLIDQRDDTLGEPAASLAQLIQPWSILGTEVRKITVVAILTAAVCLGALLLFLGRTSVGLQMRAAAMDFETARLLGVRANRVAGSAVLISGLLAAIVAVLLTVQQPIVTKDFAFFETIVVLAGVVLGGMNRLLSATLGGFAIGYTFGLLQGALPTDQSQYVPSFLFGLVIIVLLVRPQGLFTRGRGPVERV
ncbi:MAG: branched-chain amino acid ABC transporter permease [Gaiella sp.]